MSTAMPDPMELPTAEDYAAVVRALGAAQRRCAAATDAASARVEVLEADNVRLRAEIIRRDTLIDMMRERADALELKAAQPASRKPHGNRLPLPEQHAVLCVGPEAPAAMATRRLIELAGGRFLQHSGGEADDAAALEASLAAADLVICQTGCVSHGAYWRVQDHCRRTGKQCLLVEQPQAIRIVRRHADAVEASAGIPEP